MTRDYALFAIPGIVKIVSGGGGLPLLRVRNRHAECEVYFYGAHIARFRKSGEDELLWMSPTGRFEAGVPIRGGIPICFPWFGPHPTRPDLPIHGLVRTMLWEPESTAQLADGRTRIVLRTADDEGTRGIWPHRFGAELTVTVGEDLEMSLLVENRGTDPFRYDDCFHSYFKVGDPYACDVEGLDGVAYIDRVRSDARSVQRGALRLGAETVNAYMGSPGTCSVRDPILKRRILLEHAGFASTVVWNPGAATAAKNPEIGAAWNEYLCVESANCLDTPIILLPGTAHRSALRLRLGEE